MRCSPGRTEAPGEREGMGPGVSAGGCGEGLWGETLEGRELGLSPSGVGGAGKGTGLSPGRGSWVRARWGELRERGD